MNRIEKLPADVEARLGAIRDEWLAIGLRCDPADRGRAERGVDLAYSAAGLAPPPLKIWLRSPHEGAIGATMLARVGARVWAQVGDRVRTRIGAQVGAQVWAQVGAQVWAQVGAQVGDQVGDQVRTRVEAQVRTRVEAQVWKACYGQHDASWLAFYATFAGLLPEVQALTGHWEVARSAGWWWPFRGAAILTERPTRLHRDERGRLHNPAGPAILYPDGWGIWASHGVWLPRDVIERPESITVASIDAERNAEVRRVMVDRFGPARFIRESGARLVHRDDWGTLYRREMPGDEPLVMVKVVNATREPTGEFKDYWIRVDPKVRTAREAVAWTFAEDEETYAPLIET